MTKVRECLLENFSWHPRHRMVQSLNSSVSVVGLTFGILRLEGTFLPALGKNKKVHSVGKLLFIYDM